MSQEPINIAGVCAFPNPNGVRDMRFVDCNYKTLSRLPNHSSIIMTKPDGTQMKQQCSYIDDYHIYIGQCGFHIMEFAEMAWRNGYTYLPEHPREQDCCDTYALYQLKDVIKTDYFCCTYERAKGRIRPADYRCVYRSNLGPGTTLEDLRKKHSVEHRPGGGTLRSLCDSDILLVNQHEVAQLLGLPDDDVESLDWYEVAERFTDYGFDRAIATLGASGSVVIENGRWHRVSAAQVNAVDTTGCGDSFMGTVLAGLAAGHTLLQSAQIGSYVSAYAATKLGAQSAYGTAEEVIADFS